MPGMKGPDLLSQIKSNPNFNFIPCIMLSSSTQPADIKKCYSLGASGYLKKPISFALFIDQLNVFNTYWGQMILAHSHDTAIQ